MEDKELQQLFDAKRWQKENQRQQEAIVAAVGGHRRRWLGWATAAAAAVAAILLLMPPLHQEPEAKPMLVAQAEEPHSLPLPLPQNEKATPAPTTDKPKETDTLEILEKLENLENLEYLESLEPQAKPEVQAPSAPATAPRTHRRRGNLLAETVKQPEKSRVPPLIAHYLDIPDSLNFTSNIVIPLNN